MDLVEGNGDEVNIAFETSCGDVYVKPEGIMYSWFDFNLEEVQDDKITDLKQFCGMINNYFHIN